MARAAWILIALVLATGCYSSDGRVGITPATDDLACAPDALSLAWASPESDFTSVYHSVTIAVAPGGALLARGSQFGSEIARMRDGVVLTPTQQGALDGRWARTLEIDGETGDAIVREVATGELVRRVARPALEEGWYAWVMGWLSEDGARAFLLQCDDRPESSEARASVRRVDLASGAEVTIALPVVCGPQWSNGGSMIHIVEDGRAAIVIGVREPGPDFVDGVMAPVLGIARVDFEEGAAHAAFPASATSAPLEGPFPHVGAPEIGIVASAVSDGELAIVARDGMRRRLDPATLAPIVEPIAVPILAANWDTYLPSAESPVAYSEGGALLAHVLDVHTIAIRDVASGEIVATLELPFATRADGGTPPPMALRFVGDGLIVSSSHGMARFACGGEIAPIARPAGELAVRASGPASVRLGEPVTFRVEVENATLPVVRRVVMGAGGYPVGSLGPDVLAYTSSPGSWDVEHIVDDGTREARTTTRITITE